MPTPDLTAGSVMDTVASLMNDTSKQNYTYVAQLPYLKMALQDLRKLLELNNSPITNETSVIKTIPASATVLGFNTIPALPIDLIDIQRIYESPTGLNQFVPMDKIEFIPVRSSNVEVSQFRVWAWISNEVRFLPSVSIIDVKLDYIKTLFTNVVDQNSQLSIINADSYLQFRTAALCAEFIGENATRAMSLNNQAIEAFEVLIGIDNKSKQGIYTRRRPFRAAWKHRGIR
jgi:hypothetical protein